MEYQLGLLLSPTIIKCVNTIIGMMSKLIHFSTRSIDLNLETKCNLNRIFDFNLNGVFSIIIDHFKF